MDLLAYSQAFLIHLTEKIDEAHVEIDDAVVREIFSVRGIIGVSGWAGLACQEKADVAGFFVVADEVEDVQVFFAFGFPEAAAQLLQEHDGRFGRAQEEDHVDGGDVHAFVEHVNREDHFYFARLELRDRDVPILGIRAVRVAVHCRGGDSSFGEVFGHGFGVLAGAAKAQRPLGAVFEVIFIDQVESLLVIVVGSGQFFFVIAAPDQAQTGVVGVVIDSVIAERDQHTFVDRFLQGDFVGHVVITELVDVFAVHAFRRGGQAQQKAWFKIRRDPAVLVVDGVVELVDHDVIEVVRGEVLRGKVPGASQRRY